MAGACWWCGMRVDRPRASPWGGAVQLAGPRNGLRGAAGGRAARSVAPHAQAGHLEARPMGVHVRGAGMWPLRPAHALLWLAPLAPQAHVSPARSPLPPRPRGLVPQAARSLSRRWPSLAHLQFAMKGPAVRGLRRRQMIGSGLQVRGGSTRP
ncbi:MAG: hypothetical protein J3K34DRAFT_415102 [Monoraphidium minutum]|nr:MAG: hypothetical protein J3K34DRAFT_415102 [Monoraphidium minutum]